MKPFYLMFMDRISTPNHIIYCGIIDIPRIKKLLLTKSKSYKPFWTKIQFVGRKKIQI